MRDDYDIVGSYDNQRVSTISAQRTVNMFEYNDPDGKRPKVMLPTAGLRNANLAFGSETGGARATFVFDGAIYNVFGGSIFRTTGITNELVTSLIGVLTTSVGFVGVDANQFQVIFVDGVLGYIWDTTASTFTQIRDTSFPAKPIDVCYLDGFFLVANGDTNKFQLSMLNQGMVWGPASNQVTTTIVALPNQLIIGISNLTGGAANTNNFQTGVPVILTLGVGGSLVGSGLTTTDTYYIIRVDTDHVKLATSYENAIAGTAITITANITPIVNLVSLGQLQQGEITSHPGTIVGCRTLHRRIFLFSQNYTEVWENAGIGTNLPFRRNNSLLMEVGTPAVGSISVGFDRLFFLAQDKDGLASVMEVKGTEANPVSNRALDFQLAQYAANPLTGVADARGVLIKENGIIFYRLNFTLANHTFVLNVTMSQISQETGTEGGVMWHEEEILNGDRHPAQTHAYYGGVNYFGAYDAPIFYMVDARASTNNGEAIRRMRIGKQMTPKGYNRLRIDRFQLDVLQGDVDDEIFDEQFLLTENNNDILTEDGDQLLLEQQVVISTGQPTIFLAISKDGGQSYGYYHNADMGKIGERTFRSVWRKLGTTPRGQGFTPKIEFFNQIPFVVLGAAWDYETMPE